MNPSSYAAWDTTSKMFQRRIELKKINLVKGLMDSPRTPTEFRNVPRFFGALWCRQEEELKSWRPGGWVRETRSHNDLRNEVALEKVLYQGWLSTKSKEDNSFQKLRNGNTLA